MFMIKLSRILSNTCLFSMLFFSSSLTWLHTDTNSSHVTNENFSSASFVYPVT
jgi:hypothetical protein